MPIPVVPKSTDQPGVQPTPQELLQAELALNADNGILYAKMADGTVLPVKARPLGGYGSRDAGTFDGGCCPPVVTETGEVIPGVVSQVDDDVFRISSIACNPSGATCKWGVTFFQPAGQWGAYHLRGEVRDPATGATKWTFIAVGLWLQQDAGQWHTLDISTAAYWRETDPGSDVVWSPQSPASGWQPTGRYVMAVGNSVNNDTGPRVVTPVYVFAGPGAVPSCACDPPFPPDYGSWVVVDNGAETRYDCVGGQCIAKPARKYAVQFRFYPADGVTSFDTEAAAIAAAAALTTAGGQYATLAACEPACVAGAWVLTPTTVQRWQCSTGCNTPLTWTTYTGPVFTPGATANPSLYRYATQQEALSVQQAASVVPGFESQSACQLNCPPTKYKCVTSTLTGVTTNTCTAVPDGDVVAAIASGASLFPTQAACQQYCGSPAGTTFTVEMCSSDGEYDTATSAQQLSQMQTLAADLVSRGWSNVTVSRAVQPSTFLCGGATGPVVTVAARCPGTVDYSDNGPSRTILWYRATGSIGWYETPANAPRCNPNPAP